MPKHDPQKTPAAKVLSPDLSAIVIAAFGSTRKGRAVFQRFHEQVKLRFPDHDLHWAYTSKIIRQKTGGLGLRETLDNLQAAGYSSAAILPLQVFPGSEYQRICDTCSEYGDLQIVIGETLMQNIDHIEDVLAVVEKDFLKPDQGLNLLALHGTTTQGDEARAAYLHITEMVTKRYDNAEAATLEGESNHEELFTEIAENARNKGYQRVRIIPMLLLAGMHVEKDLMGEGASWRNRLEQQGLTVECLQVEHGGENYFKSLASYPEIEQFYLQRLGAAMRLLT